jgi:outer membrane protein OmpA-like peptidoglycan-associated protein
MASSKPALSLLALSLCLTPVIGAAPDRWGGYDFAYQSTGDARIKPVQVFDDGRTTFFQFRAGEAVPAIFADTPSGPVLLMPVSEGPYVKVPSTPRSFVLKMGRAVSHVNYANAPRQEGVPALAAPAKLQAPPLAALSPTTRPTGTIGAYLPQTVVPESVAPVATTPAPALVPAAPLPGTPAPVLLAAAQPIQGLPADMFRNAPPRPTLERDSYSTPIRGDLVDWSEAAEQFKEIPLGFPTDGTRLSVTAAKVIRTAVANAKGSSRFEVVGHDDGGLKEKIAEARASAVVNALVSAGAARRAITSRVSADTRELSKGHWVGVTLRVIDTPAPKAAAAPAASSAQASIDLGYVAQRLQKGEISPSEAVMLIQKANQASAVVPRLSAVPPVWQVRRADETLEKMLQRWTREAGWRLVWLNAPAVPVIGDSQISRPDLVQAVDYVISQVRASGHQVQATAYLGNKTLVVKGE